MQDKGVQLIHLSTINHAVKLKGGKNVLGAWVEHNEFSATIFDISTNYQLHSIYILIGWDLQKEQRHYIIQTSLVKVEYRNN